VQSRHVRVNVTAHVGRKGIRTCSMRSSTVSRTGGHNDLVCVIGAIFSTHASS